MRAKLKTSLLATLFSFSCSTHQESGDLRSTGTSNPKTLFGDQIELEKDQDKPGYYRYRCDSSQEYSLESLLLSEITQANLCGLDVILYTEFAELFKAEGDAIISLPEFLKESSFFGNNHFENCALYNLNDNSLVANLDQKTQLKVADSFTYVQELNEVEQLQSANFLVCNIAEKDTVVSKKMAFKLKTTILSGSTDNSFGGDNHFCSFEKSGSEIGELFKYTDSNGKVQPRQNIRYSFEGIDLEDIKDSIRATVYFDEGLGKPGVVWREIILTRVLVRNQTTLLYTAEEQTEHLKRFDTQIEMNLNKETKEATFTHVGLDYKTTCKQ